MTMPTSTPVGAAAPARRTQLERSAATRARVMAAAIDCLHRYGYGATGTALVAAQAGVSRGAMVHQFPAKADLMLAVVRHVYSQDAAHYRQSLELAAPAQWVRALPSAMWEVISRPSGIAVMEIMLASRADRAFADRLGEVQRDIDREAHPWLVRRLAAASVDDHPDSDAIHRLFVAAVRGLALQQLFQRSQDEVLRSIAVLGEALCLFYPALLPPE